MVEELTIEYIKTLNEDVAEIMKYQKGDERAGDRIILKYNPFFRSEANKYVREWREKGIYEYDVDDAYQMIVVEFTKTLKRFKLERLVNEEAIRHFRIISLCHNRIKTNIKGLVIRQGLHTAKYVPTYSMVSIDHIEMNDKDDLTFHEIIPDKSRRQPLDDILDQEDLTLFYSRLTPYQKKILESVIDKMCAEGIANIMNFTTRHVRKEIKGIKDIYYNRESVMF